MKTVPAALSSFLSGISGDATCWRADLFTLTLRDSTAYYWTTADIDIVYGGHTFLAGGGGSAPLIKRGALRQSSKLQIDTLDVTLSGNFAIGGTPLPALAVAGFFDGARLKLDHMIGVYPGDTSLGAIASYFEGPVSTAEPQGVDVVLRVKSQLELLNMVLPRFIIQPQCGNALYDANCGVVRATYTTAGTTTTGGTALTVRTTTAGIIAKANDYYNLGVLVLTSGALSGQRRGVRDFAVSGGIATITVALPITPVLGAGITFDIYPGCDRSTAMCNSRFSNLTKFRGFPFVPRPEAGT